MSSIPLGPSLLRVSDCRIDDLLVSKKHFRIYSIIFNIDSSQEQDKEESPFLPPLIYCEDLESFNGTYVNGELIGIIGSERKGFLLNDGDIIEIRPLWQFHFHQRLPQPANRHQLKTWDLKVNQSSLHCSALPDLSSTSRIDILCLIASWALACTAQYTSLRKWLVLGK